MSHALLALNEAILRDQDFKLVDSLKEDSGWEEITQVSSPQEQLNLIILWNYVHLNGYSPIRLSHEQWCLLRRVAVSVVTSYLRDPSGPPSSVIKVVPLSMLLVGIPAFLGDPEEQEQGVISGDTLFWDNDEPVLDSPFSLADLIHEKVWCSNARGGFYSELAYSISECLFFKENIHITLLPLVAEEQVSPFNVSHLLNELLTQMLVGLVESTGKTFTSGTLHRRGMFVDGLLKAISVLKRAGARDVNEERIQLVWTKLGETKIQ